MDWVTQRVRNIFHRDQALGSPVDKAIAWLKNQFPEKRVIGFELNKSDTDSLQNALHLDCCCSPLGMGHLLLHRPGFAKQKELDVLIQRYSESHIMDVTAQEMQTMHCNVFSIAPDTVISNRTFERTNAQMRSWGYHVIEVELSETSKMGGLLRCSTLPLRRR